MTSLPMGIEKEIDETTGKADICCKENRYKDAEEIYTNLLNDLKLDQEDLLPNGREKLALVYNNRGHSRYMQVNFEEALHDYNYAIFLDTNLAVAYYNRGTVKYRLCAAMPQEGGKRKAMYKEARGDIAEALRIEPGNTVFKEALDYCLDVPGGEDGVDMQSMSPPLIAWKEISPGLLVKLLFLLDNGDITTGWTEITRKENTEAAKNANNAFYETMMNSNSGFTPVVSELQRRIEKLKAYGFIELPADTKGAAYHIIKQDKDLLRFIKSCNYLGISVKDHLDEKVEKVINKLKFTPRESEGNFVLFAENLRMISICDILNASQVYKLFAVMKNKRSDEEPVMSKELMDIEGMKETLFFYIIRSLELDNKLNRIYTDTLEDLFEEVAAEEEIEEEKSKILELGKKLRCYPDECQPVGYCLVFCVTDERDGSENEGKLVQNVFEEYLGFTVDVHLNPTGETVKIALENLMNQKYCFYDSLVLWFITHGSAEEEVMLADENFYSKKEIIDCFSKLKNFNKKPKLFFMSSCRGDKTIPVSEDGGVCAAADSASKGETSISINDKDRDITAVYFEMDRLIASATLPSKYAFRLPEGSVYLKTVCDMLKKHAGENITVVLEKTSNKLHQRLFRLESFEGMSKQACHYDATFQKSFIVPKKNR